MADTSIEWTDKVWNPTRGCSRVSPGCGDGSPGPGGGCYAERQAYRFSGPGQAYEGLVQLGKHGPRWTGKMLLAKSKLAEPLTWRTPKRVFVNSMSDLFHEGLTNEEIAAVFGVIAACPHLTFQLLTKRAERLREWHDWVLAAAARAGISPAQVCVEEACNRSSDGHELHIRGDGAPWPLPNVHQGVSVENQQYADERIPELLRVDAAVHFVSYEPALGPVDFRSLPANCGEPIDGACNISDYVNALTGAGHHPQAPDERLNTFNRLDWVIVGGESGPGARPFDIAWACSTIAQCKAAGVACFVKQMGRRVLGDHTGFRVDNWDMGGGRRFTPGARNSHQRPRGAVAFSLFDKHGGDMNEWPEDLRVREFPEVRS